MSLKIFPRTFSFIVSLIFLQYIHSIYWIIVFSQHLYHCHLLFSLLFSDRVTVTAAILQSRVISNPFCSNLSGHSIQLFCPASISLALQITSLICLICAATWTCCFYFINISITGSLQMGNLQFSLKSETSFVYSLGSSLSCLLMQQNYIPWYLLLCIKTKGVSNPVTRVFSLHSLGVSVSTFP